MLLFIDKIFKGIAKAVEEMERQQAEQAARQLAAREAARNRRTAARQSVEQSAAPIQLGEQHTSKPLAAAHHIHSRIENYGDENVFDEYVADYHDPTDGPVDVVDLSSIQSKSSFESDRTHQIPLAPHALNILSQSNGPRDACILNEIFNRPEHRWG